MLDTHAASVSTALAARVRAAVTAAGGWLPFDRFMAMALYEPDLGYYANAGRKFGLMPASGSDFVTAPELSPWFGRALAAQVGEWLDATGSDEVWEFGAGSGALAAQLLETLGERVRCYTVIDVSTALRERQARTLAPWGARVAWAERLPDAFDGVVLGNEVLDAMPVRLVRWDGNGWLERGVTLGSDTDWAYADRPCLRTPDIDPAQLLAGTVTEIHDQAHAFVATVAERLRRGVALLIDYGFPAAEYYHPQRVGGTLMCHRAHRVDDDPLTELGLKDITAHINFSAVALAAQTACAQVIGYTSQAQFLLNCGLTDLLQDADLRERNHAHKLLAEHEMGELFKVIAFARDPELPARGFVRGDRTHRL